MALEHFDITIHDGLAELTLDRPKVNAMNREVLREMAVAFRQLDDDDDVGAVLLRGAGKCFSAGLDLMEVASLDERELDVFLEVFDAGFGAAFRFSKPLAAAVHGHAIAGGLVLALCADYLCFQRGDYKCGLTELAVGVPFPRAAWEIVASSMPPRALRLLVHEAGTHPPDAVYALGVGDALEEGAEAAARRWLALVMDRPLQTFRHVKVLRRGDAWAATERETLRERRALIKAMHGAKREMMAALGS